MQKNNNNNNKIVCAPCSTPQKTKDSHGAPVAQGQPYAAFRRGRGRGGGRGRGRGLNRYGLLLHQCRKTRKVQIAQHHALCAQKIEDDVRRRNDARTPALRVHADNAIRGFARGGEEAHGVVQGVVSAAGEDGRRGAQLLGNEGGGATQVKK
jgi:hypothetical protein